MRDFFPLWPSRRERSEVQPLMPSEAYDRALAEATAHHARSKTYSGKLMRPHKIYLTALIARLGIGSALDYGCGKGAQYEWVDHEDGRRLEDIWGFTVAKYDPAWPPFAAEPVGQFDLVICTHVLGSIPVGDLDWALGRVIGFARKAVFLAEKIGPVKKTALSDPEGRPVDWPADRWLEAATPRARAFAGEVHFSFARKIPTGIETDRYRFDGGRWVFVDRMLKP